MGKIRWRALRRGREAGSAARAGCRRDEEEVDGVGVDR